MFDLSGKVALVTGGGQGVGIAIAQRLVEQGAAVAINDIASDRADAAASAMVSQGGRAISAVADVTDRAAVDAAVAAVIKNLGPIDVLVNNAGVPQTGFPLVPFMETSPNEWHPWIALNLYGVMHCTQAVLQGMIERGWGRVITIVSDAGRFGERNMAIYAASKAGAAGFVRGIAKEVGRSGVTSNAISLGSIEPPHPDPDPALTAKRAGLYPMKRLGRPDDVPGAVVWLASDEASWITGQTISINGGYVTA
jgi:2-hydroxycyclohexanecarboxyl-CoA dehydrogenase